MRNCKKKLMMIQDLNMKSIKFNVSFYSGFFLFFFFKNFNRFIFWQINFNISLVNFYQEISSFYYLILFKLFKIHKKTKKLNIIDCFLK